MRIQVLWSVRGAQVAADVGKRDVGDAGVEDFHEGGARDDHSNQPGIVLGLPNRGRRRNRLSSGSCLSALVRRDLWDWLPCVRNQTSRATQVLASRRIVARKRMEARRQFCIRFSTGAFRCMGNNADAIADGHETQGRRRSLPGECLVEV